MAPAARARAALALLAVVASGLLLAPAASAAPAPAAKAATPAPAAAAAELDGPGPGDGSGARAAAERAAEASAALVFYNAVSAATEEFVRSQIAGPPADPQKNATAGPQTVMDVPNPLALIAPEDTAELVLNMYPVGPAFAGKKPEAQKAAVRQRMEMAGATANLTAAVKLEQAQRLLGGQLGEGSRALAELRAKPDGKVALEACPLALLETKVAAAKDGGAAAPAPAPVAASPRAACLSAAALNAQARLNATADVMAWLQWQESRLNTNLVYFLNWAFGGNDVADGRMLAPVVVVVSSPPAAAAAASSAAGNPAAAAAAPAVPAKAAGLKVVDVLLFQGGPALANKTPEPPRGYDPAKHRLMDPTCAVLAFWQTKNSAPDRDLTAKIGDLARGRAASSKWWNVASVAPPVALRRFDCAPFTWEDWVSGKRQ